MYALKHVLYIESRSHETDNGHYLLLANSITIFFPFHWSGQNNWCFRKSEYRTIAEQPGLYVIQIVFTIDLDTKKFKCLNIFMYMNFSFLHTSYFASVTIYLFMPIPFSYILYSNRFSSSGSNVIHVPEHISSIQFFFSIHVVDNASVL